MGIPFIKRDARQMIHYGKEAKDIVDQMQNNLRIVEGVLDACRSRLDANCHKKIDDLHEQCNKFYKEIAVYRTVAETIEKKGIDLQNAQEMGD